MSCRVCCVSFTYQCFRVLFRLIVEFIVYVLRRDGAPKHTIEEFRAENDKALEAMTDFYTKCAFGEDECCED